VCLLVVPAAVLVFLPIDPAWGWIVALGLYAAIAIGLVAISPMVEVDGETLRAGRARIPLDALGDVVALDADESRTVMHTGYDANAFHSTVPWTRRLVRASVADPADPTTAWIVSSRRPEALAAAIAASRSA
jgi:hypothetical protein